jgi:GPH family glycoside/pentoside/hexuronide:cation symporter
VCAFFCKENPAAVATQRDQFFKSLGLALKNKPFVFLTGTLIFTMFGIFLVMPMATYVNIYYLFEGDQSKSASLLAQVGTIQAVAGIALVPVAGMLISRFGAARLMRLFLFITAVSFAIKFWTYTPANPWLQAIPLVMWAFSWAGVMLAFNVMLGDVCDLDDFQTGERREGIYGAINQFLTKLMIALSTALSGVLLSFSGIVAGAASQTPEAVWWLRIEFSILPFLVVLLGSIAFYFYPLSDARAHEVRLELKKRKSQTPA